MNLCWVTIRVSDMSASLAFYRDLMGMTVTRRLDPAPGTEIVFLGGSGATELELILTPDEAPRYGDDISLGFDVVSLPEMIGRLRGGGITDHAGPFQPVPTLRFIYVRDPDGVKIQLVEHIDAQPCDGSGDD
jgi:lactoylglutathione lyase